MSYIFGVQIGITSGCAVYKDGSIVFAASEERFSRKKNDCAFPVLSIQAAVDFLAIKSNEITKVLIASANVSPVHFLIQRECTFSIDDYIEEQHNYYKPFLLDGEDPDYLSIHSEKIDSRYQDLYDLIKAHPRSERVSIFNEWKISKAAETLGVSRAIVSLENHERSHACYAYYASPFRDDDTLILTADGFGDHANASVWVQSESNKLKQVTSYKNFNIGRLYRSVTLLLGMKPSEHEFKVMGLAPYSSRYNSDAPYSIFADAYKFDTVKGEIIQNPEVLDHYFYFRDKLEGLRFDGIAGGIQRLTEELLCQVIVYWLRALGLSKVVISGGVSLNIKANLEVSKLDEVLDLYVPPSGGDESLCIGCIYSYLDRTGNSSRIRPLKSMSLGLPIDRLASREINTFLSEHPSFRLQGYSSELVANLLSHGNIVGFVNGRAEFGARALGNRSILADPRNPSTIKKINTSIKNRDFWMPFTPSVLDHYADQLLINNKNLSLPFMTVAAETTLEAQSLIPAALHPSDMTARPQVLARDVNPKYYELIESFGNLTGVYSLLNTSLNLHGLPVVQSVEDAFHVLLNSSIDCLVIDDSLITRECSV